jgi:hypothetical protein
MSDIFRRKAMKLIGAGAAAAGGLASMNTAAADEHVAYIRAIHASPDAGGVEVSSDRQPGSVPLSFKGITPYVEEEPGTVTYTVAPTNPDYDPIEAEVELEGGEFYTGIVIGEFSEDTAELVLMNEEKAGTYGPAADDVALTCGYHAVPDAGEVRVTSSVRVEDNDLDTGFPESVTDDLLGLLRLVQGTATGTIPKIIRDRIETPGLLTLLKEAPGISLALTLFDHLSFGEASDFLQVPEGDYELSVEATETGDSLVEAPVSLAGGEEYLFVVVGYADSSDEPVDEPLDVIVASTEDSMTGSE